LIQKDNEEDNIYNEEAEHQQNVEVIEMIDGSLSMVYSNRPLG